MKPIKKVRELFSVRDLEVVEVELPESVTHPHAKFESSRSALVSYVGELEDVARKKRLNLEELRIQASAYKFGPDESFHILGLFDTIRALKAAE